MKTVTIIGVGALGSHVALFLRNHATLVLIDFDKIEQKNVLAQFHTKMGVGKNKAGALSVAMNGLFGVQPKANVNKVTPDNVEVLLRGSDLVIDCTDNMAARTVIRDYVRKAGIPCVHGALSADGTFGRIVWDEHFVPDAESGEGATCEDGENLPFFGVVASHLTLVTQHFLRTGAKRSFQLSPTAVIRLA